MGVLNSWSIATPHVQLAGRLGYSSRNPDKVIAEDLATIAVIPAVAILHPSIS